jgi:hypothetical protein
MKRAVLLAVLVLTPFAAAAQPYYYLPFKMMNNPTNPFPWYQDDRNANPVGLTLASAQASTQNAWLNWDNVSCASTAFSFKGGAVANSVPNPGDPYDIYNVSTLWVTSDTDPFYTMNFSSHDVTSLTLPLSYAGVLQQCDIYMNGVDRTWQTMTPTQAGATDVETLVLHEVGHCQGLDHSYLYPEDVMYATTPIGDQKRVLSTHDIGALCAQYPAVGGVGSPCLADGGCGSNPSVKCVKPPQSDGGPGLPVCTVGCTTGINFVCTAPFACKTSTLFSPMNGACLPPGQNVTPVGHPCTVATQAVDCPSSLGQCIPEGIQASSSPLWKGGYCSQSCNPGMPDCPSGSECIDFGDPGLKKVCLKQCRIGTADCLPGYTCVLAPSGNAVCASSCYSNADCDPGGGYLCRVCDGTCLALQSPTGQIGDACVNESTCGAGQVCAKFGAASQGICSQPCAGACTACPTGSTCHPVGSRGELYCLRDCHPHTCPTGLQCGQLPSGSGCMPPCAGPLDCPVGNVCDNSGECVNPYADYDAGCTLCPTQQDGGNKQTNGAPDAGTLPGPGSGGCGCRETSGSAGVAALLALAAALSLRRRSATARVQAEVRDR